MKNTGILIILLFLPFILPATPQEDFLTALRETRLEDAAFYIRSGGTINEPLQDGKPALILMCQEQRSMVVRWLLKNGADPGITDNDKLTPLMHAAIRGSRDIAQLLLLAGAQINRQDPYGNTALQLAVNHGHWQLASYLEEKGGALGGGYFEHPVLSEVWLRRDHYREALMLVEKRWPSYEFLKAVRDGDYHKTAALLEQGYSANSADSRNVTALMISASLKTPYITDLLLREGADFQAEDDKGLTALWYASLKGNRNMIAELLERGVSPDGPFLENSPLFGAFSGQQYQAMEYLLQSGADPELTGRLGACLVHYAAFNGDMKVLRILDRRGTDLTVADADGRTALDYLMTGFILNGNEEVFLPAARFLKDKKTAYTIDPKVTGNDKLEKIVTFRW